jgi:cobalt-precorrin 5A hydrolase/precorrin-3B C17-methyltransferase
MALSAVLVALTARGERLARALQPTLAGSEVHGLAPRTSAPDVAFEDTLAHLRQLFRDGRTIVGICAAGIVIRALAPLLADKHEEPPVLALAEDGSAIVPLLGGHRGANALARRIAHALGREAAITTSGDLALAVALDEPPPGWRIATPKRIKPTAAALIAGETAALRVEAGDATWLSSLPTSRGARHEGSRAIVVTHRATTRGDALIYHPPVLALGVGCERGADPQAVIGFARHTIADAGLACDAIALVASIDLKSDEPAVHALAATLDVPARFFAAARLAQEEPRLATPSQDVRRAVGVAGVAEAAALAAAGASGDLVLAKRVGPRCTIALALAASDIDATLVGKARGRLSVVGIGPGRADWRTPEASAALVACEDVVGYGLYLDLLGSLIAGKRQHARALGEEEARVRLALDLAAAGRRVALVSSGDAGIYALATLVFELVDREPHADWRRVAIEVCPGVSALQAAAARAGAPLGHDFCAISLSDLLTPWAAIERRLRAAIAGDFVIALFNPVSTRRQETFARALDILRAGRNGGTPVVVARNLGREGEDVQVVELGSLDPSRIDMLTILIVGSSQTRRGAAGVYTPRGYADKR